MSDAPNRPYLSLAEALETLGEFSPSELVSAHVSGVITFEARKRRGVQVGDAYESIPPNYFSEYSNSDASAVRLDINNNIISANARTKTFRDFERYADYEWIDVRVARHEVQGLRRSLAGKKQVTARAEAACRKWLAEQMRISPHPRMSKADYCAKAKEKFGKGLGKNSFNRAWKNAIADSEAHAWSQAGRRPKPEAGSVSV